MLHRLFCSLFLIYILFSSLFGFLFYFLALLPLHFISPVLFRSLIDKTVGAWMTLLSTYNEISGTKFFYYSNLERLDDKALMIMNHRNELDWLHFFNVSQRFQNTANLKIIMKETVKQVPCLGWAIQFGVFLFLSRRWKTDQLRMERFTQYYKRMEYPIQLLLFCEGTNMNDASRAKSNKFAVENGLQPYRWVLHPRTTGFVYLLNTLRGKDTNSRIIDYVYDFTIAYRGSQAFFPKDILMGKPTGEVHVHIEKFPIESIPSDDDGCKEWLIKRWHEKEKSLESFHSVGHFSGDPPQLKYKSQFVQRLYTFCVYTLATMTGFLFWYHSSLFRWYFIIQFIANIFVSKYIGYENIILENSFFGSI